MPRARQLACPPALPPGLGQREVAGQQHESVARGIDAVDQCQRHLVGTTDRAVADIHQQNGSRHRPPVSHTVWVLESAGPGLAILFLPLREGDGEGPVPVSHRKLPQRPLPPTPSLKGRGRVEYWRPSSAAAAVEEFLYLGEEAFALRAALGVFLGFRLEFFQQFALAPRQMLRRFHQHLDVQIAAHRAAQH
jgi:hypothetical protein